MKSSPNHHIRPAIIIALIMLAPAFPAWGDHGSSLETNLDDGGIVTSIVFQV